MEQLKRVSALRPLAPHQVVSLTRKRLFSLRFQVLVGVELALE